MQSTCVCDTYKMEVKVKTCLNLLLENMLELVVYLIHIMKIKSIRFKTPMLRSDLCDYANAYILVNGTILVNGLNPRD